MVMDLQSLVSLVVLVTTILGLHALLRKELKSEIDSVRADVRRLDDRVYALAVGMKPLIEQAERHSSES